MTTIRPAVVLLGVLLVGCRSMPKPIFSAVDPPLLWPPPPDRPRISYVGALYGQSSLGVQSGGWEALRALLVGSRPVVDFVRPVAVAVADQCVFVADAGRGAVHRLDLSRRAYRHLSGAPADPLQLPIDLAVVPAECLLVADRARGTVEVFDLAGDWQLTLRWPEITAPVSLAWAGAEQFWIADVAAHACFAVDLKSGQIRRRLGSRGQRPGQFNYPSALAYAAGVGLVVADAMNFRIQVFDQSDEPVQVFGRKGDAAGDFARPRDVAVDSDGNIYVLDNQFENVQVFGADGQLLLAFGQGGTGPGEFALPSGLTIDQHGRIWIADSFNRRVQVFQYLSEGTP
mgnify:CR=1 FL=1